MKTNSNNTVSKKLFVNIHSVDVLEFTSLMRWLKHLFTKLLNLLMDFRL